MFYMNKAQYIARALFRCPIVVLTLFCINCPSIDIVKAESSTQTSGLSLSVEEPLIVCVPWKHSVNLTCTLSLISRRRTASDSVFDNLTRWDIRWHSKGEIVGQNSSKIMRNDTIIVSTLEVHVNWTKDKVFTCFTAFEDRNLNGDVPKLNASLTVRARPEQTSIIGVRFIEASDHKLVEIYWKQNEELNYTYSLRYSIEDDDWGNRLYTIDDIECCDRSSDVYRVPNTTGHICKASIKAKTFQLYKEYKAYLVTSREQCEIKGPTNKFELWKWVYGDDPEPNQIVIIPHPVSELRIRVAMQQVELTWTNMPNLIETARRYCLHYNCSELEVENERTIIGKTELTLYGSNFSAYRPYALCEFCIRVYLGASKVPSLPVCREARLHEEAPSEPPTTTCMAERCATITDGRFRHVTIPWALPPRETWNGVLTRVVVRYRPAENGSSFSRIIERNLTQGFTVLPKLARNCSYMVQTAVCNKEGCSGYGNTVLIPALLENQPQRTENGKSSDNRPIFFGLGSALFILVVIVVVIGVIRCISERKKERRQREDRLPKLDEPLDYDNVCGDDMAAKEYDVLSDDVLIEQGESNAGLEPSGGSQETRV